MRRMLMARFKAEGSSTSSTAKMHGAVLISAETFQWYARNKNWNGYWKFSLRALPKDLAVFFAFLLSAHLSFWPVQWVYVHSPTFPVSQAAG